jgi:transcriptional regulator with XRE-family HTH domain
MAALAALRQAKGWTQADLARAAGVPSHAVRRIEDGSDLYVEPRTVQAVAAALGVDPSVVDEFRSGLGLTAVGETGSGDAAETGSGEP